MGGHGDHPSAIPTFDQDRQAMADHNLPTAFRDTCAHLLQSLNVCRRQTYYMPWSCKPERHVYEECQYNAWLARCEMKTNRDAKAKAKESSA